MADGPIPRGASIGRYVVQGWIAKGGMGEVYAAHDPTLDRRVAIKLVRFAHGMGSDADAKARLMREAQAIAKLSHPNVVIIHDVGNYEDRVFIAMEFIDGGTLTFWLNAAPRTWRDILKVFIAAGRGLQHAHEANLVHRDFKPENVMIRVDGVVRVTDFGLVRQTNAQETTSVAASLPIGLAQNGNAPVVDQTQTIDLARPVSGEGLAAVQARLTETGVMLGTPAYMAPEQFSGQTADARSDQFSFCIALYEALYGVRPFSGSTLISLATNVCSGLLKPPPERTEVPVIVWQALRRGLSVNPNDRYPSMTALLADLVRHPKPLRRRVPTAETAASASDLASLLETLLGRPVQAKQEAGRASHEEGVVAVYAAADGAAAALVHFDLMAAGSTAAALTLAPASMVREAFRAGKLPQEMMDNLLEVGNVLTKLVRGMSTARLRIQGIYALPGAAPAAIVAALKAPPFSVSFDVAVTDYPGGRITVIGLGPRVAAISHEQSRVLTRALVVDDSGAMRMVVGRALTRLGVSEILEASQGEEGLKVLREGAAVDAVFVDSSMPVMDGITFVRAVRADSSFDHVRIVMVTTEDQPEQMEAALAAGANEYLVKPISDELLRGKLEGLGLKTT